MKLDAWQRQARGLSRALTYLYSLGSYLDDRISFISRFYSISGIYWYSLETLCGTLCTLILSGAALPLGCVLGYLMGGAVSDRIGKKLVVLSFNLFMMALWISISFAHMSWLIILVRFLMGIFSSGAYSCVGKIQVIHGHLELIFKNASFILVRATHMINCTPNRNSSL